MKSPTPCDAESRTAARSRHGAGTSSAPEPSSRDSRHSPPGECKRLDAGGPGDRHRREDQRPSLTRSLGSAGSSRSHGQRRRRRRSWPKRAALPGGDGKRRTPVLRESRASNAWPSPIVQIASCASVNWPGGLPWIRETAGVSRPPAVAGGPGIRFRAMLRALCRAQSDAPCSAGKQVHGLWRRSHWRVVDDAAREIGDRRVPGECGRLLLPHSRAVLSPRAPEMRLRSFRSGGVAKPVEVTGPRSTHGLRSEINPRFNPRADDTRAP